MAINVLDCTLRDGGYCNSWEFGNNNIKKIVTGLMTSGVDIVECGFLTNKIVYDINNSKFTDLEQFKSFIPSEKQGRIFVAMVNYGEYDIDDLPICDNRTIDGIRVAFHKKNRYDALEFCKQIKNKGYKVFVQPMVSLSYTPQEFLEMINIVNQIQPYAFYIVDSFGNMKGEELKKLFFLVESYLSKNINIGFHSHNNLQLAFSNAQLLTKINNGNNIIIDSSIFGMGRGAGNLNTELISQYLNENFDANYKIRPLLNIIDEILNVFYLKKPWGFSIPNYLSATYNAHPNYANFLSDKNTLTVEDMDKIFEVMDEEKKVSFDKEYIEQLYVSYMNKYSLKTNNLEQFKQIISGKTILLIAPGKTAFEEKDLIQNFSAQKDVVTISINFDYPFISNNYIFLSNLKRNHELEMSSYNRCITTTNIPENDVYLKCSFNELLNDEDGVKDNAGLMSIKFLINLGVKQVVLAGFDGYTYNLNENYGLENMLLATNDDLINSLNNGMSKVLREYMNDIDIDFITPTNLLKTNYNHSTIK